MYNTVREFWLDWIWSTLSFERKLIKRRKRRRLFVKKEEKEEHSPVSLYFDILFCSSFKKIRISLCCIVYIVAIEMTLHHNFMHLQHLTRCSWIETLKPRTKTFIFFLETMREEKCLDYQEKMIGSVNLSSTSHIFR
jgi:hypothetical protein